MSLLSGARIGPYEILSELGAGGMGEVYRARDPRLDRDVAIKILRGAAADDPGRVARFQREAKTLAALNHPNIGGIHGVEELDGRLALVMELVEGEDLAGRIGRGAIPLDEALSIARQIAEALEAAHEHGIVHRDLKPANVKLRPDGTVKVLDFGLAKAAEADTGAEAGTESITAVSSHRVTEAGTILGTAAYMSPEQARGRALDRRADIWAFGCVLYEMLAGRPAFGGPTLSDTLVAVLEHEPDFTRLPGRTPAGIRRLLRRCLEKDARRRLRDIGDARLELEEAIAAPRAEPGEAHAPRAGSRSALVIGVAAGLGVAIALLLATFPRASPPVTVRIHQLTDLVGLEEAPALSPDGKSVAFTAAVGGKRRVFVRLLAGGPPLQVSKEPATDHFHPRWSRDASSILYLSPAAEGDPQGTIWAVPALGGAPRSMGSSLGGVDVNAADGRLAFFRLSRKRIELVTAPEDGSSGTAVASFEPSTYYLHPRWSPDGKWIAFQRGDRLRVDVFCVPSGGGEPRQITRENTLIDGFSWLPDSTGIVYSAARGSTMPYLGAAGLWRIALDGGAPRQVTSGESSYLNPDVAPDGTIVVSRLRLEPDVWMFPVDGAPQENVRRAARLTRQTGQLLTPTVSPGGNEVAFLSDSGGHANLWVLDVSSGALRQITHEHDPTVAVGVPIWSPDGRAIAFVSSRGNPGWTFGVWLVDPDGSHLRQLANPGLGPAWSPDGRWLYYSTRGEPSAGQARVVVKKIPVDGGESITVTTEQPRNVIGLAGPTLYTTFERPLVDGTPDWEIRTANPESAPTKVLARIPASRVPPWQILSPALSPDGGSLAQPLTDGFTTNIWVLSTATAEWRQITDFGERATFIARRVSWSVDGRSILAAVAEGDADVVLLEGLLGKR